MGTASTKLKKHLQNGDEYMVLKILHNHPELNDSFDPNQPLSGDVRQNSALHLASSFAMKPLMRLFLFDLNGDPNKVNALKQTPLHLVCQIPSQLAEHQQEQSSIEESAFRVRRGPVSIAVQERRAMCAALVLQWKRKEKRREFGSFGFRLSFDQDLIEGQQDAVDVSLLDSNGETALHYAAYNGLRKCVELLVDWGCPLFTENKDGDTACDLAQIHDYNDICEFLEMKMVFFSETKTRPKKDIDVSEYLVQEDFKGLRQQDLQEAKDQLLVETQDMLRVPLFIAEALLRYFEWSREGLLEDWMRDKKACCEKAGVQLPARFESDTDNGDCLSLRSNDAGSDARGGRPDSRVPPTTAERVEESTCGICSFEITKDEGMLKIPCRHKFCIQCWKTYLTYKIQEGDAHNIFCPAFQCMHLVPVDIIEKVVSPQIARRFLQFDLNAFVESNPTIKWCPAPGCGKAVRLSDGEMPLQRHPQSLPNAPPLPPISFAVDCGSSHYFCWDCLGEAHAPCDCGLWEEWMLKISEVKPDDLRQTFNRTEDAANSLWLIKHSKQCPRCRAHIQKTDGCNHMKCTKCRHDFCWICLEPWKKHSSATGGYFRCTKSDAAEKVREATSQLKAEAEARNCELQELKRFVHHYTRFKFNEDAYKSESSLLDAAKEREQNLIEKYKDTFYPKNQFQRRFSVNHPVAEAKKEPEECGEEEGVTFLSDAVLELCKARRVLCGSSVYGYYLEDHGYNKTIFEFMEGDLEAYTNRLSHIISKPYLQAPRSRMKELTCKVKKKRIDFFKAISKGLIPPETPPSIRKRRRKVAGQRRFLPGVMGLDGSAFYTDNDFEEGEKVSDAILASLNQMNPDNPWIKDSSGKHANLAAIYDWPDDQDSDQGDEDENDSPSASGGHSAFSTTAEYPGICSHEGCEKQRVKNPRTGEVHPFCSLACKQLATPVASEDKHQEHESRTFGADPSMELLLAIEMSRLQATEDRASRQTRPLAEIRVTDVTEELHVDTNHGNISRNNSVNNNSYTADYEDDDSGNSEFDSQFDAMIADLSRPPSHRINSVGSSPAKETIAQKAISFFLKNSFTETTASKNKNLNNSTNCLTTNKADKSLFSFSPTESQGFVN